MNSLETTSRGGILPLAIAVSVAAILRLGAVTSRAPLGLHAALRGGVFFLAATVLSVRALGVTGHLGRWPLFGALLMGTALVFAVRRDVSLRAEWRRLVSLETLPVIVASLGALLLATVVAWLLPVWQWDSLGYHLPYVDFALQGGSLHDVPPDMPYLSTYPHVVEDFFIAWRAMLPDDRLVDTAQLPLGLLGVLAIAVIARDLGARTDHALAAGFAWLMLPATFLQLPTNYIDVGTASLLLAGCAFVLAPPSMENVAGAGVAMGLFLGSKPNAPIATTLLGGLLLVRGYVHGRRTSLAVAPLVALLLGVDSYVVNIARHRNPIWPVQMRLGPIELPGLVPMQALLESGCGAPRVRGALPFRLLRSWTAFDAPPIFDMRFGGLEVVFLLALPVACVVAWKRRSIPLAVCALAALASPDPAVPRYVLAFPGLVLAVASSAVGVLGVIQRRILFAVVAIAGLVAVMRARPGLLGEGPPLADYLRMDEASRLRAVGADGPASPYYDALDRLQPGDVTAFDASVELPYLAWRPDLATSARWIEDSSSPAEVAQILADSRIRLLMIDDRSALAEAVRADPRFEVVHHFKERKPPQCLDVDLSASRSNDSSLVKSLTEASTCVIVYRR